ncbi:phage adaptor protein [Paenibacillus zanthoxyli]|uniref:phage adaptor protein n=1 Tax=Paenibacillus zanthoxyli TaxID=369399 RepID=UPI000471996E|nr:hypothetical protein [Paenibacillus zanthoxyli]
MLVSEVVEEIAEKSPNYLSPQSILRKITSVRDRLFRAYTGAQRQSDTVCTAIDLYTGVPEYPLPCPPGNVVDVDFRRAPGTDHEYLRIPLRQFNERSIRPYYYFQAGRIGIVPAPDEDIAYGLKVFHVPVVYPLTLLDMGNPTGFDPDYDMLLVFGVLREITSGIEAQEFDAKYQQLLAEYTAANSGYERYAVKERW